MSKGCHLNTTLLLQMMENTDREEWSTVSVAVAPSTVSISFMDGRDTLECR